MRFLVSLRRAVLAVAVLGLADFSARCAVAQTVFTGLDDPRGVLTNSLAARANFLAALSSSGTDDIESYAADTTRPTLTFGATGITAATTLPFVVDQAYFATSGTKTLINGFNNSFLLSAPVTGFGVYVTSGGNGAAPTILTLRLSNSVSNRRSEVSYAFDHLTNPDNVLFIGVTSVDTFDQVVVLDSEDQDTLFLFDDVTVGFAAPAAAAPEPSGLALVLPVLPVAGRVLRRGKMH